MSTYPFQVSVFDHMELDVTEVAPLRCWGLVSFYRVVAAHNDEICELCGDSKATWQL